MEPTYKPIDTLVKMYLDKELLLPEMQRKYVWKAKQVRDLLDSIYRDYPSGSILIWDTKNIPELKSHPLKDTSERPIRSPMLLLDGQQRITSLATILSGIPIRVREGRKVSEKNVEIMFNIDHPDEFENGDVDEMFDVGDAVEAKWDGEEDDEYNGDFFPGTIKEISGRKFLIEFYDGDECWTDEVRELNSKAKRDFFFQVKNKGIENNPNWISVTKLFMEGVASILKDRRIGHDHPKYDLIFARLNKLQNIRTTYYYPIQVVRDKSYREVTEIFVRVNDSGTALRASDLALAQLTSVWPGSMKLLEEFIQECAEQQFFFDENFLVRCLVCIGTGQAKFDQMASMKQAQLSETWRLVKRGIEDTITFLKGNTHVDTSHALPSPILMIPLIAYSSTNSLADTPEKKRGFIRWLYSAALWSRYSGSMETRLSQDLAALKKDRPWSALFDGVAQLVGPNRTLAPSDIRGKGVNSPIFSLMYLLARSKGAIDFETGHAVAFSNMGRVNKIEADHLFPQSKLKKHFKDKPEDERKKIINELANMAFLTKKGNIIKTNDDPAEYFPKVISKHVGVDVLERQQVPTDKNLWSYERYDSFLDSRASLIADGINQMIESLG